MAYGMAVSRQGFDVKNCADFEKVFDSRWKCLKIEYQGTYTVGASSSIQTIYTHGLGYAPFFMAFLKNTSNRSVLTISDFDGIGGVDSYGKLIRVNSTSLVFDNSLGIFNGDVIYVYVFVDQINEAITESLVKTTSTSLGASGGYGLKVSKAGKDVKTATGKDLILSTEYATLQINQVSTGSHNFSGGVLNISHGLGYPPQFYFYARDLQADGRWEMIGNSSITAPFLTVKASSSQCTLDLGAVGTKDYTLIVFKDPIT